MKLAQSHSKLGHSLISVLFSRNTSWSTMKHSLVLLVMLLKPSMMAASLS